MQDSKRDTDVKNRLLDSVGGGEGGMIWENSIDMYIIRCEPDDQARTLEWVAISFSNAWKWKVKVKSLSRVWLFAIPWTAAYQASLSMGFSRQEYWSGLPLLSPIAGLHIPFFIISQLFPI